MCTNKIISHCINCCGQVFFPSEGRYDHSEINECLEIEFTTTGSSSNHYSKGQNNQTVPSKPLEKYIITNGLNHIFHIPKQTLAIQLTPTKTINSYTNGLEIDVRPVDLMGITGELPDYIEKCYKTQYFTKEEIYTLLCTSNNDCFYSEKPFHFLFYSKNNGQKKCKQLIMNLKEIKFNNEEIKDIIGTSYKYTDNCNYCADLKVFLQNNNFNEYVNDSDFNTLFDRSKC